MIHRVTPTGFRQPIIYGGQGSAANEIAGLCEIVRRLQADLALARSNHAGEVGRLEDRVAALRLQNGILAAKLERVSRNET